MEQLDKEAADRDPFGFDYAGDLPAGDNISTSSWSPDVGIVLDTATFSAQAQTTSVWVSGGVPNGRYIVRNNVVSVAGRRRQRQFLVVVTDDA